MRYSIGLWDHANKIIPGGNHLFSKTPNRYCPGKWPPYYITAQGITIEIPEKAVYKDFCVMGAGNSILGYQDKDVDLAVFGVIARGNVSTLNCPEEVLLADVMLELNPKMDMVRFGRSGNDACQIALRIAREYTGARRFAICGYHGWQIGHPPQLDPDCNPFEYGDTNGFFAMADAEEPQIIMMEPVRSKPVNIEFLKAVREYCDITGAVLIFDEIASGFRCNLGGYHQLTNVNPDIVLYGKAMGNGFAISAVVGKREVMKAALNTFISSMQWSERLGPVAGLATIEKMDRIKAQETIMKVGKTVKNLWQQAAIHAGLEIEISGLDPLATFAFVNDDDRVKMTTFTQEMLKKGYLASGQFYASVCHTPDEVALYREAANEVFEGIASGSLQLEGDPAQPGFRRLA